MNVLVIESSTSSAKAMVYNSESGIVAIETEAYNSQCFLPDGSQDAQLVAIQTLSLGNKIAEGYDIDLISLCCTWHSLVLCDEYYEPISSNYTWTYGGAAEVSGILRKDQNYVNDYYHRTGCMVNATYPSFKLLQFKKDGQSFHNKRICSFGGYLYSLLTGCFADSESVVTGSGLYNIHHRNYDNCILDEIGVSPDQFAEIMDLDVLRPLASKGASLLGLETGIPVIPAQPDGGLNQLGAGALNPGVMTFSVGTSAAIRVSTREPWLPEEPSTWCYRSPVNWLVGAATAGACNCVDWLKGSYFSSDRSYESIEKSRVIHDTLPIFLPFLFGERCPGWDDGRSGGFFGITKQHRPEDLYHSVLEGILFNIYQCYRILCSAYEKPVKIKLSGGILNSRYWIQMCSDIFQQEMECVTNEQSSVLGGAALALYQGNVLDSLSDFEVEKGYSVKPDLSKKDMYEDRFHRYIDIYDRTKDMSIKVKAGVDIV